MHDQQAELRGFGAVALLAIAVIIAADLVVKPLSAVLVLVWAHSSQTPLRDLGFVRPRNWLMTALIGLTSGIALKFAMKAVVMPLLGAPPMNQTYAYLHGNSAALPGMLYAIVIGAGFGEETLFRGFFFERLRGLSGRLSLTAIVIITSVVFGLAHYPEQGLPGVQQALIVGLAYGAMYARTRSLALPIIAHVVFDLTAVWMIYNGLESRIATSIFPR